MLGKQLLLLAARGLRKDGLLQLAVPQGLGLCSTWLTAGQQHQQHQQQQQWSMQQHSSTGVRQFASKPQQSKQKQATAKQKKQRLQQQTAVDRAAMLQQHTPSSSSSSSSSRSLPKPRPLLLPSIDQAQQAAAAAAAPRFGRVPPSSAAAAAAAAAALKVPTQPGRKLIPAAAAGPSSVDQANPQLSSKGLLRYRKRWPSPVHGSSSSLPAAAAAAAAADADNDAAAAAQSAADESFENLQPKQNILPWEVVDSLQQSSPFSLEAMASGGIRTYMAYLRAARMGMPSVFDLGIVKGQGYWGRRHLLEREKVLTLVLEQLQASSSSSDVGVATKLNPQQQQQQQSMLASAGWEPSDEQLEDLTEQQIDAVAAAATGQQGGGPGGHVTPEDVSQCLVDYFLFKRCMETLLLKRQYRQAMKAKHHALLREYHHQQQQQQQQGSAVPATLLTHAELSEVTVWDAFFDATLEDYRDYLQAGAEGEPIVFNTSRGSILDAYNPPTSPHQQQQQQREGHTRQKALKEFQQTCQDLSSEVAVLHWLLPPALQRPRHISADGLVMLAVYAKVEPGVVVQLFEDFYEAKRRAFVEVLEELLTGAGRGAASSMGRF